MVETDLMSGFIADTLNKNRVSVEAGVNSGFGGRPVVVTTTTESVEQIRPNQSDSNSRVSSGVVAQTSLPFKVTLIITSGDTPTYQVTVDSGYVCERIPGVGNAISYHEPANIYAEVDPPTDPITFTKNLQKFAITVGQAVYVRLDVNAQGQIGPPEETPEDEAVTIVVAADEENSTHYIPKVDTLNSEGTAGFYLYKLAVLEAAIEPSTIPTLEKYLTGSHIDHFQDLPSIMSTLEEGEGIGVIPKEWDNDEANYKLRVIAQKVPTAAEPPLLEAAVQIHVNQEADKVVIEGNSKHRLLKYKIGNNTEIDAMKIDDGLEILGAEGEGNEETIHIPEVEVERGLTLVDVGIDGGVVYKVGLPEAEFGDMLYFDGDNWVLLVNPGVPDSGSVHVLQHDGTEPGFVEYEQVTVDICQNGTPVEYTILGIPTV